ncbi:hypothetical protein COY52_02185 [Candidatus Desantisbacteria bacterium CG_4_10_14_0_8_um_filter_48_22]|uniref:PilZ domain-containing protein n=1 Tax=Candidatus Desantisbacteria bacterium CG_4_10_14_0_8_um_filter_48_22 TaxID=1974543 RepID=A0A2M7SEE7_9BACT|nr:MAG: hypothetical protein AUJ67_02810 [Candidatus Desantisbacteria bacterium CG1_02_49_89]PIV54407.1 MAG: hypothetical protein COS16_10535 [Candidatus Desantisbacteria bacterium CG02_land_8_20_14_3_00_49_13]PIZ17905.1 MAG: hypothetical protein COY52_02185 [Candidatus Desantisbacteria bacterium CG_4_10_14_0_8_um_filter_48_22]PJB27707.1 MAG: hypothetical protein CO111_03835 [Candidatus Desantisbacteria bacterium CG_4_9_14_3_um_filter_50_7]
MENKNEVKGLWGGDLRIPTFIQINFKKMSDPAEGFMLIGSILDLGIVGVKLETEVQIVQGENLLLRIPLSFLPRDYSFTGTVRWVNKTATEFVAGVELLMNDKKIHEIMKKNIKKMMKSML